jgi:hypothetical protein
MGKDTVRWLTYAAILVCLGALMYIISQKNKSKLPAPTENTTEGVAGSLNTFPNSAASQPIDTSAAARNMGTNAPSTTPNNALAGGNTTTTPSNVPTEYNTKVAPTPPSVLDVTPEVASRGLADAGTNSSSVNKPKATAKTDLAAKGTAQTKLGISKTEETAKFDAGDQKSEFMVVAGVFAVGDHATTQVQKLQKLGFKNAVVAKFDGKLESTVIAGAYPFRGSADAAVRTLAKNKVASFVRKRTADMFTKSPAPAVKKK